MSDNNTITSKENNDEISSSNIFDDFDTNPDIKSEVEQMKIDQNKDMFYYLSISGKIFQKIFMFGILIFLLIFSYIYIQKSDKIDNNSIFAPICKIFIGDISMYNVGCSSISTLKEKYTDELVLLKSKQYEDILSTLPALYKSKNFSKSKDVNFLLYKSNSKLEVTEIIKKFNDLKLGFDSVAKDRIQCKDFIINSVDRSLKMNCTAYTDGYEEGTLLGLGGTKNDSKMGGTSISLANSFLNYISKQSNDFDLINKQKVFKKDSVSGDVIGFTYKTDFKLTLNYNF